MAKKVYKFRIYPNKEQEVILKKTIGCCRYVYNWGLDLKKTSYNELGIKLNPKDVSRALTELKKNSDASWLNEVSSTCLQQSLRDLESGFKNFFEKRSRFPRFKSKKSSAKIRSVGKSFSVRGDLFYFAKLKSPVKIIWTNKLPSKPSSCTVSLNSSNQWFASFVCEEVMKTLPPSDKKIGIDLGLEVFVTNSDGKKIKQPISIKKIRKKLLINHKRFSRKKNKSKNKNKARIKLAKTYQKVKNIRKDFLQKMSTQLIRENQTIVIEDLGIKKMTQEGSRSLSRLIGEQGWREFRFMLEYKAKWYGRELIVIDRFFPSSKTCSCCGKPATLTLKDRVWSCSCGATHDRDVNAARNILAAGMAVSACGVDGRPVLNGQLTLKQEVPKFNLGAVQKDKGVFVKK